jgi:polysaccharide chain length determinant protein (PEP-CTERM system associated)
MDEIFRQVLIISRGMWRYRWIGLSAAWVVGVVCAVGVMFIPDRYEASARIFVNTASILKPLMMGITVTPNDDSRIAMLSRVVISRPNVEKLIQMVGLDAEVKSKDGYEKLIDSVTKTLVIKTAGRDNLYTLSYRDVQPERAKRVVQVFSSIFIESGQGGKSDDTDAARKFIDEQIVVYEKKLQEAEARLKDFKLKYLGITPGEGQGYFTRLSEANVQLNRAQLELREAENSRDAYRRQLASEDVAPPGGNPLSSLSSSAITDIDARIDAMRRNLDSLLQKYTENHPDVVGAQRVIKELEDQRRQIVASRPRDSGVASVYAPSGPRASEQLKVSLAGAEASVASLRARVAEYSIRYNQLKSAATQMPQLEAEFAQLNRDYDVNKKNYESLVSKRESANISSDMQSVSGVADFRTIDPPRVSPNPVAPNRKLLFPIALLVAIAAGFGAAFVAREVRPAFYDGRSLSEATGLPILGTVSMILSEPRKKQERNSIFRFATGAGALVGFYAVGFVALSVFGAKPI